MTLDQKKCVPCEGKAKALTNDAAVKLLNDVAGWQLSANSDSISRQFGMKNFMAAIRLINKIASIAEEENHHPDIHLSGYRNLEIVLTTHALNGLSENDFILAAKINQLPLELKVP